MNELTIICFIFIILAVCGFVFIEVVGHIDNPKWNTAEWIVLGIGLLALMLIVGCAISG